MNSPQNTVRNFFAQIRFGIVKFFRILREFSHLNKRNWKWISAGTLSFIILFVFGNVVHHLLSLSFLGLIITALLIASLPLLFGALIKLGVLFVGKITKQVSWLVFASVYVFFLYFNTTVKGVLVLIFYFLLTFVFLFGSVSNLSSKQWLSLSRVKKLLTIFFLSLGICNVFLSVYFLTYNGPEFEKETNFSLEASFCPKQLEIPDPSIPGPFTFQEITYGTGRDKQRVEFAEKVDLLSHTVDGSAFIDNWDKFAGKMRTRFWGFDSDSLPLNGRMWLPEGQGTFPIVLIVHGNHFDRDFSDKGYEFIARHLASYGVLTISIDENFLNSGLLNFNHSLLEENDARGWLLLKHLELLRSWNGDSTSILLGKADTQNVILIGHSRGGEAVNIAACFNNLPYYPDNFEEKFDFNFGVKGVIAIAQVDGQYEASNVPTPLSNIDYLSIQGSLDADLNSYHGLRQYNRLVFNDSLFHFKAGIYIQGANHGQFNTSWGVNDIGYPNGLLLNKRKILAKEEQEKIALVYISSFLKASLMGEYEYLNLMSDYRVGRAWLPKTKYINQYSDSKSELIADFDEDLDLTTTRSGLATCSFNELAGVYEKEFSLGKGKSGTKSLAIGWNNEFDTIPGIYMMDFNHPFNLDLYSKFQFDVAVLTGDPGQRKKEHEVEDEEEVKKKDDDTDKDKPLSFSIQFVDVTMRAVTFALDDFFPLNPPIRRELFKLKVFEENTDPEIIPQHIELDIRSVEKFNPSFRKDSLRSIRFIFDEGEKGLVTIDNIGFY